MIKGSLRSLLLGSAVTAGLIAAAGTANAIEYNFGELNIHLDTTISAGASIRTSGRDNSLLPTSNGGPLQATNVVCTPSCADVHFPAVPINDQLVGNEFGGPPANPPVFKPLNIINAPTSLQGSINTDDGRLNFDKWDMTSGVVKMTNDLSATYQNYHFFGRLASYYDFVLANNGSYARSDLVDGKADAARDIKVLDLYGSADYDVGGMPLNIRAGKQVISWGESTFIQNGINSFNPIDVSAVRRPGAELKEFFIPVWAVDASIGLPYNLSLEAFYQLKWDTFALDRPGTPFASSDVVATGSGIGGNYGATSFLTGSPGGNIMTNCSNPNPVNAMFNALYASNPYKGCGNLGGSLYDYTNYNNTVAGLGGWPVGDTERIRLAAGDSSVVKRDSDRYAKNSGQWGLAARWYSEDLNNTEFGVYFSNTHSRLPIASERVRVDPSKSLWQSYLATSGTSSSTTSGLGYAGCNALNGISGTAGANGQPGQLYGVPVGLTPDMVAQMNQGGLLDTDGVFAAAETMANSYYASTGVGAGKYLVVNAPAATSPFAAGIAGVSLASLGLSTSSGPTTIQHGSILEATIINCALIAMQSVIVPTATGYAGVLTDGAQTLLASDPNDPALGLFLEYPENIKMYGASFNTTIGTWGVQGEFSFRPNAPMQLDTDQLTLASLNTACTFQMLLGATSYNYLIPLLTQIPNPETYGSKCGDLGTGASQRDIHGYIRSKMWTAQVGTTATYSNSNSIIEATGADLGILVTEVGMVYTPDAPDESHAGGLRWGNVCTTGTDLPLGSFLSLASRNGCRPTTTSWGYVLLGQLQYNNAFGTAVTLSPSIAFSHDVSGNTAAPYSNYRQGRKSINLEVNATYQSAWKAGVSYTNFFGNDKYNDSVDRDYAAVNISYTF
ncbi:DUF1302 domain-containing protein [Parvibaculum sp.]|uniref:DUF1302 domain-containing protein n=1 Tax=Parvibaculum sp. TaxID=2024848 RepID=UPI00320FFF27